MLGMSGMLEMVGIHVEYLSSGNVFNNVDDRFKVYI
jgi:hypothetical protein